MFGKMRRAPRRGASRSRSSHEILLNEESDELIDQRALRAGGDQGGRANGIVFLDELDKMRARDSRVGGDVSRQGVQRDLLPVVEGTTVIDQAGW